ncbi:MAG TPA: hypothetical protein VF137_06910 [Candidatus Dormibacteraeota bacterium]
MHRHQREVLIPGLLPWGLDAVVFCWRCDRFRGKPESTRPITAHPFAAGAYCAVHAD